MSRLVSSSSDKDALVKHELCKFILKHTGLDALSLVDEIVMCYIIGVLESLEGSEQEEAFDVNEFAEMMCGYIPAFSTINTSDIHEWMLQLANWLRENSKKNRGSNCALEDLFKSPRNISEATKTISKSNCDLDSNTSCQGFHPRRRTYHRSCSCSSSQSEDDDRCINVISGLNNEVDTLVEMFPNLHIMEAKQFLSMADGDCEQAVQLILQKLETGQHITESFVAKNLAKPKVSGGSEAIVEDKKVREHILNRYAYIDQVDDAREHKPVAPKTEPKKLIRYRDNKIVSIKGERYSEIKSKDPGDTK